MEKSLRNPNAVIWDVTFACPLRCVHCYTESGRRPAKNLTYEEMIRVADAIISMRPKMITLCGGEPLTIKRIVDLARHFDDAGVRVFLYTSGWALPASTVEALQRAEAAGMAEGGNSQALLRRMSREEFEEYQRLTSHFSAVAGYAEDNVTFEANGDVLNAAPGTAVFVTPNYFDVIGVRPVIGAGLPRTETTSGVSRSAAATIWKRTSMARVPGAISRWKACGS